MNIIRKLKRKDGVARIIWILVAIIIVLLVVILIPLIQGLNESAKQRTDKGNEQTAWDSAIMRYYADGEFEAIYDLERKEFIEEPNGVVITGYGMSKENKNKVILVNCDSEGNIILKWVDPTIYTRVIR